MQERQLFQQIVLEQLDFVRKNKQTKKPYLSLISYIKINSKWIMNLKVKHKTLKLLEKNIGENLQDLRVGKEFLDLTPKAQSVKEKKMVN